ncbi:MAG: hypothetical protein ACJA1C_002220 [Crocinitomicaceae bacterium]|jgi:hypothetical protein
MKLKLESVGYNSFIPSDVEALFVGIKTGDVPQLGGILLLFKYFRLEKLAIEEEHNIKL